MSTVKECRNASSKSCSYGEQKCWFRHDPQVDNNKLQNDKNEEVTEKIFKMLETFTLKIIDLENHIKTEH